MLILMCITSHPLHCLTSQSGGYSVSDLLQHAFHGVPSRSIAFPLRDASMLLHRPARSLACNDLQCAFLRDGSTANRISTGRRCLAWCRFSQGRRLKRGQACLDQFLTTHRALNVVVEHYFKFFKSFSDDGECHGRSLCLTV